MYFQTFPQILFLLVILKKSNVKSEKLKKFQVRAKNIHCSENESDCQSDAGRWLLEITLLLAHKGRIWRKMWRIRRKMWRMFRRFLSMFFFMSTFVLVNPGTPGISLQELFEFLHTKKMEVPQ